MRRVIPNNADIDLEARELNVNNELDELCTALMNKEGRVDVVTFWTGAHVVELYSGLTAMAQAALSIFHLHVPVVESSFSTMQGILLKSRAKTEVETYSSLRTI